jgi:GT2 family glycosyltransferase
MSISIIIPNLHSPLIGEVVAALERQTARDQISEIIVVGQDRYGRVPPSARFVASPRPVSAAAARNLGAAQASGDKLLFLDADCIAAPDLVERLLAAHRQGHPVVGGAVAIETDNYWMLCDNLLVFAPFLATAPAGPRPYLVSMCLSVERRVFDTIGGFDERFGSSGEDMDLSMRLRMSNYGLHFEPPAQVLHRPSRASAGAVWAHLRAFGRAQIALVERYGRQVALRLNVRLAPLAGAIFAAAPLLALWDILTLYRTTPAIRRYWRALPGMLWGRIGWYVGVVEALMVRQAKVSRT